MPDLEENVLIRPNDISFVRVTTFAYERPVALSPFEQATSGEIGLQYCSYYYHCLPLHLYGFLYTGGRRVVYELYFEIKDKTLG